MYGNAKIDGQNTELNEIEIEKSSNEPQMVIAQMSEERMRLMQEGKCFFSLEEKKPERLRIDFNINYLEAAPLQLARARLRIQTLYAIGVSSIESTLIEEIKKAQQLDE